MCTDLVVVSKTPDGRNLVVSARSQEFNQRVGYRVMLRKREEMVRVSMPKNLVPGGKGKVSLTHPEWVDLGVSRHDYAGLMMTLLTKNEQGSDEWLPVSTAVFDGMNDAGLSVGSLLFPGSQYQSSQPDTVNVFVGFFVDWLLSNFDTCAAVKDAFATNAVRVVADNSAGFSNEMIQSTLGQHFAVHDADGNSVVIECIDGRAEVSDNPVGVLTNLPALSWHLTNLGLYAQLSNFDSTGVAFGKLVYTSPGSPSPTPADEEPQYRSTGIPGVGNGLAGLPGDFRPASRFVRTAYLKHFAIPPETREESVSQAFHLLNAIDIVKGAAAELEEKKTADHWYSAVLKPLVHHKVSYDTTQCIIVKDLIHKTVYVRMYESPLPYCIDFNDFSQLTNGAEPGMGTQITIPVGPTERLAQPLGVENVYPAPKAEVKPEPEAILV
jgi:choloylglycine hydrolase